MKRLMGIPLTPVRVLTSLSAGLLVMCVWVGVTFQSTNKKMQMERADAVQNTLQNTVDWASYTLEVACMNGDQFTTQTAWERLRQLQHSPGFYGLTNPFQSGGAAGLYPADSTGQRTTFREERIHAGNIGVWVGTSRLIVFGYGDNGQIVYWRERSTGPFNYRERFQPNGKIAEVTRS